MHARLYSRRTVGSRACSASTVRHATPAMHAAPLMLQFAHVPGCRLCSQRMCTDGLLTWQRGSPATSAQNSQKVDTSHHAQATMTTAFIMSRVIAVLRLPVLLETHLHCLYQISAPVAHRYGDAWVHKLSGILRPADHGQPVIGGLRISP